MEETGICMRTTHLLLQGMHVRLIGFGQTPSSYRRQLLALGMTRGTDVTVIRVAPLGCPIQIEVRGVQLALRQDEARFLEWELI